MSDGARPLVVEIEGYYLATNATVTGDVVFGAGSNVWFGCVIRGDDAAVRVGAGTNIQDLTMVHADPGVPNLIGDNVTVGHRAILHGARVGSGCLVGMGSVLLAGSVIGEESIIGAGAVVPEGREIPGGVLALGVPARVVRDVTDEERAFMRRAARDYVVKAREYATGVYKWTTGRQDARGTS